MNRPSSTLILAVSVIAGCSALSLVLFQAFYTFAGRNFSAMLWSLLTTSGVLVVVWILLWRKAVQWTLERCWLTGLAVAVGVAAGTVVYFWCHAVMGLRPSSSSPLCMLMAGLVFATVWILLTMFVWRETSGEKAKRMVARVGDRLRCPKCGYNMTGLFGARCPECGTQYTLDELLDQVLSENDFAQDIIVEPPAEGHVVEPMAWFETPGPFELEIGCGKGGFLLYRALGNPQIRMLGIEWANKFFKHCADRMARRGVSNVRVMRTDAKFFVMNHLPAECVSVLHLYHPDPWPKKRHHKRRLVQEPFVAAAVQAIARGGQWLIQSDHAEYFEQMHSVIGGHPEMREIPWEESAAPMVRPPEVEGEVEAGRGDAETRGRGDAPGIARETADAAAEWRGTNFEIKYAREGREIYRAAFVKD